MNGCRNSTLRISCLMANDGPRELELKYHLRSRGDYQLLLDDCRPAPGRETARLENYYFDSAEYDIAAKGGMLRLRFDGELKLCFKLGGEKDGHPGYFDVLEVESSLEPRILQKALKAPQVLGELQDPPIKVLWEHFKPLELTWIGQLVTVRRYRAMEAFLLELDEVTYPNGDVVFEVEIETPFPEEARGLLLARLTRLGIEAEPQRRSKLQGLLKHKGILPF